VNPGLDPGLKGHKKYISEKLMKLNNWSFFYENVLEYSRLNKVLLTPGYPPYND
jgi:hypothetical protein